MTPRERGHEPLILGNDPGESRYMEFPSPLRQGITKPGDIGHKEPQAETVKSSFS